MPHLARQNAAFRAPKGYAATVQPPCTAAAFSCPGSWDFALCRKSKWWIFKEKQSGRRNKGMLEYLTPLSIFTLVSRAAIEVTCANVNNGGNFACDTGHYAKANLGSIPCPNGVCTSDTCCSRNYSEGRQHRAAPCHLILFQYTIYTLQ